MRSVPADDIVKAEPNFEPTHPDLGITIDGYVFPMSSAAVFAAGKEQRVALLHGNNSRERVPNTNLPDDLKKAIGDNYGPLADSAWAVYSSAQTDGSYGTAADQWGDDVSFRCAAVAQVAWHSAAGNSTYEMSSHVFQPEGSRWALYMRPNWRTYSAHWIAASWPSSALAPASSLDRSPNRCNSIGPTSPRWAIPTAASFRDGKKFDASTRAYIQFTDAGPVVKNDLRRPFCDLFIENVKRLMVR